ncbi:MAG: hypothetical protein IJH87_00325 [Atopobiaceae bacterium]|nr:hypothetical protein [Atopobiaceae bacterium]
MAASPAAVAAEEVAAVAAAPSSPAAGFEPIQPDMDGFVLGTPALVCRWRIAGGSAPLLNRHIRALSRRVVNGASPTREMLAWVKQHIEWTRAAGSIGHPDGVLMLIVDEAGKAAMTVGDYVDLPSRSTRGLVARALDAHREAERTSVAPETLWTVADGVLHVGLEQGERPGGTADFISQLSKTLGLSVIHDPALLERAAAGDFAFGVDANGLPLIADALFLVSDEHGVFIAEDFGGDGGEHESLPHDSADGTGIARKLAESYAALLERSRERR